MKHASPMEDRSRDLCFCFKTGGSEDCEFLLCGRTNGAMVVAR